MPSDKPMRRMQSRFEMADRIARQNGLRQLLATADGRRFAWLFLADCRVFSQPFSSNALQTSFNCGELNVGQKLLAEITEADPDAFLVMMKENQDAERSRSADAARLAARQSDSDYGADDADDTDT